MLAGAVALQVLAGPAAAAPLPTQVGKCSETTVKQTGYRLQGVPDSGSAIRYANDGVQISYDVISGIRHSRPGDRVRLCLVSIPKDCPPGDDRGRVYKATNLRTKESWTAPDSQHSCGGA
jgi:hypothetical protein